MSKQFIKEIEIKNYKCFQDFKAKGFGRVNLISGKNNVGKTAFMEACYILLQNSSYALEEITFARYQLNILEELYKGVGKEYIDNFLNSKIENLGNIIINDKKIIYEEKDKKKRENVEFITQMGISINRYNKFYSKVVENSLEDALDKYIHSFETKVDRFRIIDNEAKCRLIEDEKFYSLNEFGDGLSKFIAFILSILSNRNGVVFIDEIENGIHYTNLDKLWEIIIKISKQQNVQVFATTHSKECIESYARVAKKLEDEEIRFIELGKTKEDKIKAIVMDSERFFRDLDVGNEVRGW